MNPPATFSYPGGELAVFAQAANWKAYWSSWIRPFLAGHVLEVGAGAGANTLTLRPLCSGRWLCLEPDAALLGDLQRTVGAHELGTIECVCGTLAAIPPDQVFDTILYLDVLEHIEDDAAELHNAAAHLQRGGHLLVLSPAYPWLFSEFDRAIGHYRRYTKTSLLRRTPAGVTVINTRYLDSLGSVLSLGNRLVSKQTCPTLSQILFWDRSVVPLSRYADRLVGYSFGRSILAIWRKV